jgi:hypothetical protein
LVVSHNSLSLTKNKRLANNNPAKNDIYKNIKFGFFVNANNHMFINNG